MRTYDKITSCIQKSKFWILKSIQGVQGGIPEGPETIPELKNDQIYRNTSFLIFFSKIDSTLQNSMIFCADFHCALNKHFELTKIRFILIL